MVLGEALDGVMLRTKVALATRAGIQNQRKLSDSAPVPPVVLRLARYISAVARSRVPQEPSNVSRTCHSVCRNPGFPSARKPPFSHFLYSIIGEEILTVPPAARTSSSV